MAKRNRADSVVGEPPAKLKDKEYCAELEKLHVELVKLQEWAKATGAKICVCFEGRDGAGKGGVIKAITERVSPRVFRVIALGGPDRAREVSNVSSALLAASAGRRRNHDLRSVMVQPRGCRTCHGLQFAQTSEVVS